MRCNLKLFIFLLPLTFIAAHFGLLALADYQQQDVYQKEHSLLKPYQGAGMTIPNWEFFGSTIVTTNQIRITQDTQSRQGGIWNTRPYKCKYWELEVGFKAHGHGTDLYGDGFALWYVKEPPKGGPVFGNKDYFTGLAVIFDTYANQHSASSYSHPKISIMVNNGTLHYDHEADGTGSELAFCESKFRGLDHEAKVLVQYFDEKLSVKMDLENTGEWRDCATVPNVYLPTNYYFGITAATGDLSDNHDILSIRMRQLSQTIHNPSQSDPSDLPRADYSSSVRQNPVPNGMSALRKLFIVVCLLAGLIAVAGFGYFLYNSRRSSTRKRFY